MKIVFVGGPYRGDGSEAAKKANVETARKHILELIEAEIPFYSPHLNVDQEITHRTDKGQYAYTINSHFLTLCDILAVLPGWEQSEGTKWEIEEADKRNVPVVYLEKADAIDELKALVTASE